MGLRDYAKKSNYTYRQRQTRLHRRKQQGIQPFSLKDVYYTVIFLLVISNTFFSYSHSSIQQSKETKQEAKTESKPQTKGKLVDLLPNMEFSTAFKAFAAEAKPTVIPLPTSTSWEDFKTTAKSIAKIYGYPSNLLISQAALESGHGTSNFALTRFNYFGIGAYGGADEAFVYENSAQSIIDYIYVIKNNFPEAWSNRDNPEAALNLLESNSYGRQYATDPDYVSKVMSEPEWSE